MDLELIAGGRVAAGGWEDVADADVLVICAATALTANTSRDVYLAENARDRRRDRALDDFGGAAIMVTNPVDPLTARLARRLGRERVLGYTFNDTLRLRQALPGHEDVWVLGEHGDGAVPIFSRVTPPRARTRRPPRTSCAAGTAATSRWTPTAPRPGRAAPGSPACSPRCARDDGEQWVASVLLDGEYGLARRRHRRAGDALRDAACARSRNGT